MTAVINKKVMAQNIKRCMKTKGISRKELCNRLGFAYSTVTDWLNAEKYPRIDKIELMANFFGVNKSELIEPHCLSQRQKEPISAPFRKNTTRIPVLGRVAAGIPIEAIEDIIDYEELDTSLPQFRTGTFFGLVIRGHSMTPTLRDKDVIIVRQQEDIDSGDIAVVLVGNEDATVKEVKKGVQGITLIGHNPSVYTPTFYSNKEIQTLPVRILGKVVELRRRF